MATLIEQNTHPDHPGHPRMLVCPACAEWNTKHGWHVVEQVLDVNPRALCDDCFEPLAGDGPRVGPGWEVDDAGLLAQAEYHEHRAGAR